MKQNIQEKWGNYKKFSICIMGMLEGEERKGTKELFEVRTEFSKINDIKTHRSRKLRGF